MATTQSPPVEPVLTQTLIDLSRLLELLLALSRAPAAGLAMDVLVGAVVARVADTTSATHRRQLRQRLRVLLRLAAPVGFFELEGSGAATVVRASSELRLISQGISRGTLS